MNQEQTELRTPVEIRDKESFLRIMIGRFRNAISMIGRRRDGAGWVWLRLQGVR
jgi:hypothetical protein